MGLSERIGYPIPSTGENYLYHPYENFQNARKQRGTTDVQTSDNPKHGQVTSHIYYIILYCIYCIPVVPHKAVAEVSKIGNL